MAADFWTHSATSFVAAFLASAVEFVEAMTVVLAVGVTRGWRSALLGSAAALAVLLVLIAALGPALTRIPLEWVQLVVGLLLLLFGLRWLRKAVLRSAGLIPLHDEEAAFANESDRLRRNPASPSAWDTVAVATAFKIVMLEGIEVVFIVVAIGAGGGLLRPAVLGAGAALVLVVLLGVALHRPLSAVPENSLKFAVGVLLSAFGTFWVGEGIGIAWPGADWSLLLLIAAYLVAALVAVRLGRAEARPAAGAMRSNVR